MHTKPPLPTLTLLPILLLLIISKSASPTPQSHPTTTTTTTTTSLPRPATPTPQPLLPRRCRSCPQNNTLGQTCYKNTLCIPLSLLCTPLPSSSTDTSLPLSSPCPDLPSFQLPGAGTTNPTPEPGSVLCSPDTNLCQDPQFLPLPAPGEGNIRRDTSSSSSCLKGSFFSLYPSSSAGVNGAGGSGNGNEGVQQKYIQSCIVSTPPNNNAGGQQPPCQDWEYRVGNSCLLRLCGGPPSSQELSCVLPYTCRKPIPSSTPSSPDTSVYGVCSNPTHPNPDDGDPSASPSNTPTAPQSSRSKKELILFNLLIALCSLVGLTALLFLLHHLRKRYLQRQGRSVLDIFARRWQQPQFQLQQQLLHDGQQQGSRIREEVEPPPLYHQGPDLPAYRVRSPEPVQEPASRDQE
ncbi:MAG: hypothetical protein JOS17DRAFT_805847 [Linnemannia elongata]|nr:MAG: hypothetical protein JOS17DRAFT_805847 [Linnemannia elongata]